MFVSNQLVYLELHKTGCSHIRRILSMALDGKIEGKHNKATNDLFTDSRVFLGSVRNPWDWYVSLWGFGCDGNGILQKKLTRRRSRRGLGWRSAPLSALSKALSPDNSRAWLATYRDVNDPSAFRDWLHMLHDPAYIPDIGENYSDCALIKTAGLMTFRYLNLFSTKEGEHGLLKELSTQAEISAWDAKQTFVDAFVRNEALEEDFFRICDEHNISLPDGKRSEILALPRTNTSSRSRKLASYYDPDTVALVADREQLILNKFGYKSPEL